MKAFVLDMTGSVSTGEIAQGKEWISNHKEVDEFLFVFDDFTFMQLTHLGALLSLDTIPQRTPVLDHPLADCVGQARLLADHLVLVTDGFLEPEELALFDEVVNITELDPGC